MSRQDRLAIVTGATRGVARHMMDGAESEPRPAGLIRAGDCEGGERAAGPGRIQSRQAGEPEHQGLPDV